MPRAFLACFFVAQTQSLFLQGHGFEPRPVGVARGNEKGRVERAIRYLRTSFFPARTWRDLDDLNAQALDFCQKEAARRRCPEDHTLTVQAAWEEEQPLLLPIPQTTFPTEERLEVRVGKTPYVRFDKNDYSVPHSAVRRTLTVFATDKTVRICDAEQALAVHPRCLEFGKTIEDAAHIEALRKELDPSFVLLLVDRSGNGITGGSELAHLLE